MNLHIYRKKYRAYYKEYKTNSNDKAFYEEYKNILILYQKAENELKKYYKKIPNSKDILNQLNKLQEKKNTLMKEYSLSKINMNELYQIRKNYETYMDKEIER